MRVLQLGPFPPPHGGVQTNLVAIHEALRARGATALVANITGTRRANTDEVFYPRNAFELLWLLIRLPFDIVHIHIGGQLSTRLVLLCLVCSLLPRARSVLTFHSGGYASSPAGRTARRATLRGLVFRRLDALIAVNAEIVDLFRRFGVPAERIRLIPPHALDPSLLAIGTSGAALRPDISRFFSMHGPILVTVGLLEPEYDLPLQIALLPRVRRRFRNAGLAIVGSGSLHEELRARIAASPEAPHLLLCGDVPHDVAIRMIATADALLRTTLYDGDSISVREALCIGTPVVATDNGMRPAGVRVFPVGDLSALERAVHEALQAGRRPANDPRECGGVEPVLELYEQLVTRSDVAARHILTAE